MSLVRRVEVMDNWRRERGLLRSDAIVVSTNKQFV